MPSKAKKLCLIGSTDTKGNLLSYLRKKARARGIQARIIDSRLHGGGRSGKDGAMLKAAGRVKEKILRAGPGCAFLAIGGGTGSWIALQAMSALPQGVPKALVTTLAFDPRPYVAGTDIVLVPCPVDLQGTNQFLEAALDNGLDAVLGLHDRVDDSTSHEPMIAITALGVVQPCVDGVMEELERIGHRTCVFHAAGSNGATLAKWILGNKTIKAVVDLAPNDLHPLIGNGTGDGHAANRLAFAARTKTPYLLVPGGLDFLSRPTGRLSAGERQAGKLCAQPGHSPMSAPAAARCTRLQALLPLCCAKSAQLQGSWCQPKAGLLLTGQKAHCTRRK